MGVREAAHDYTITAFEVIEKPAREMNLEPRAEPFKTDSVVGHFLAKCRGRTGPLCPMGGRGYSLGTLRDALPKPLLHH